MVVDHIFIAVFTAANIGMQLEQILFSFSADNLLF